MNFIIVKNIDSHHIFPAEDILRVGPIVKTSAEIDPRNNSRILLKTTEDILFSTETVEEIYNKIKNCLNPNQKK